MCRQHQSRRLPRPVGRWSERAVQRLVEIAPWRRASTTAPRGPTADLRRPWSTTAEKQPVDGPLLLHRPLLPHTSASPSTAAAPHGLPGVGAQGSAPAGDTIVPDEWASSLRVRKPGTTCVKGGSSASARSVRVGRVTRRSHHAEDHEHDGRGNEGPEKKGDRLPLERERNSDSKTCPNPPDGADKEQANYSWKTWLVISHVNDRDSSARL